MFRDRYTGLRNVAGDGNCYYRGVFYGALERHLLAGDYSAIAAVFEKFLPYIEVEGVSDLVLVLHRLSIIQSPIAETDGVVTGEVAATQLAQLITANAEIDAAIIMVCKNLLVTEIWQQREAGVRVGTLTWNDLCDGDYDSFEEVRSTLLSTTSMYHTLRVRHTACRLMSLMLV
jgi:Peptidase C65 Otubain